MKKNFWLSGVIGVSMLAVAACGNGDDPAEEADMSGDEADEAEEEEETDDAEADDDTDADTDGDDGNGTSSVEGNSYTIATDNNFVPFAFMDLEANELTGFDIDLMTAISEEAGFEIEFETMEFSGALAGIQAGSYDASINGMSITEERMETIDFSDPYYESGLILAVMDGNEEIQSIDDVDGMQVGTRQASTSQEYLEENTDAEIVALPEIAEAYQSLVSGHVDAVLYDEPNVLYYSDQEASGEIVTVGERLTGEDYGIGMPKGHELVEPVNEALAALMEDGTYGDLYEEYFGERPDGM